MGRALLGLIKGLVVGSGVGYGLILFGHDQGVLSYLACGLVGLLVGLVCGRAPWRAETIWTPAIKMIFGFLVGLGLYALGHHFIPAGTAVPLAQDVARTFNLKNLTLTSGAVLAPLIGMLYGLFVEVDDGGSVRDEKKRLPAAAK